MQRQQNVNTCLICKMLIVKKICFIVVVCHLNFTQMILTIEAQLREKRKNRLLTNLRKIER